jgi:hypothetical protein
MTRSTQPCRDAEKGFYASIEKPIPLATAQKRHVNGQGTRPDRQGESGTAADRAPACAPAAGALRLVQVITDPVRWSRECLLLIRPRSPGQPPRPGPGRTGTRPAGDGPRSVSIHGGWVTGPGIPFSAGLGAGLWVRLFDRGCRARKRAGVRMGWQLMMQRAGAEGGWLRGGSPASVRCRVLRDAF